MTTAMTELAPATTVRPAAVAGRFYPGSASQLKAAVQGYLEQAAPTQLAPVRAVVAPHAGYVCSGPVAGAAFRALQGLPTVERVVYLLGPAHWKAVHGVGLCSAEAFATPLGRVAVAGEEVAALAAPGGLGHLDDPAHAPEHCLEVELPFLQCVLGENLAIVPMLFDEGANLAQVAAYLAAQLAAHPADLIVVSSDLSHYHPYADAVRRDRALLAAIVAGDSAAARQGEACGILPILCLMLVARQLGWQAKLLAYANSGDTCGPRQEVVGYGAVAFTAH